MVWNDGSRDRYSLNFHIRNKFPLPDRLPVDLGGPKASDSAALCLRNYTFRIHNERVCGLRLAATLLLRAVQLAQASHLLSVRSPQESR